MRDRREEQGPVTNQTTRQEGGRGRVFRHVCPLHCHCIQLQHQTPPLSGGAGLASVGQGRLHACCRRHAS